MTDQARLEEIAAAAALDKIITSIINDRDYSGLRNGGDDLVHAEAQRLGVTTQILLKVWEAAGAMRRQAHQAQGQAPTARKTTVTVVVDTDDDPPPATSSDSPDDDEEEDVDPDQPPGPGEIDDTDD